jgi:hypothetical protein
MAVYREGFDIMNKIQRASQLIYPDACDYGAPAKQGDTLWNDLTQLIEWYGVEGSVSRNRYGCCAVVELVDEWAVSDGVKTMQQATQSYYVSYTKCTTGSCRGYDGFIYIDKLS